MEVLTDSEGVQANTIAQMETRLRGESFPTNGGNQYYELAPSGQANQSITQQSVNEL